MLLKSIKLHNFRQFINTQLVHFSIDPKKNVSVIIGENGSGKTSFAQAFTWCLYGETEFRDKNVINKSVLNKLSANQEDHVEVELELIHNSVEYTIHRTQKFKMNSSGNPQIIKSECSVSYKDSGQKKFLDELEVDERINEILPIELSRYFFFDGERIEALSKEIRTGKSKQFAEAVKQLLGLKAIQSALDHLKPTSQNSVVGKFNSEYDYTSNKKIEEYTKRIDELQAKLDNNDSQLENIDQEIRFGKDHIDELIEIVNANKEGEILQQKRNEIQAEYSRKKKLIKDKKELLLKRFNREGYAYFTRPLNTKAFSILSKSEKIDKGIPEINSKTIEFLLSQKKCICGADISEGSHSYKNLIELLDYIPPRALGTIIGQFIEVAKAEQLNSELFFDQYKDQFSSIREFENALLDIEENRRLIDDKLACIKDISNVQRDLQNSREKLRNLEKDKERIIEENGRYKFERTQKENDRKELTLKDVNNRAIEEYKSYAIEIYEKLSAIYSVNESKTRIKLQEYINELFQYIYKGGLSLTIDENYNIQVHVEDFNNFNMDVETSTAQNISIIFAFITGVIKIGRENSKQTSEDIDSLLSSEPYPLVMDAPLSAFDKRRINTVCDTLPKIAEQVIVFIKDTDGEIAEDNMSSVIGRRYIFEKSNEFETQIMPR